MRGGSRDIVARVSTSETRNPHRIHGPDPGALGPPPPPPDPTRRSGIGSCGAGGAMAFHGWKVEALEFFEGLEVENSKAFWERNKATYEQLVRAPMEELLAELAPDWGDGRIFRPYRDVR